MLAWDSRLAACIESTRRFCTRSLHVIAAELIDQPSLAAATSAQMITSFSHAGRRRSDTAFAALASTNPISVGSGRTVGHRPNRGGDRAFDRCHPHLVRPAR